MPSMPKCDMCGAQFFPEGSGWSACADCLAAEVELTLLKELRLGPRKPMRRGSATTNECDDSQEAGEARKMA
jgi:hypothetical protein